MGTFQPNSRTTFAEYAAQWVEIAPLKEQTRYRYRGIVHNHLIPVFGTLALPKIHPQLVRAWLAEQVRGELAASSVRQNMAVLRSCLRDAHADWHIGSLPTAGMRLPRAAKRRVRVLSLQEAVNLIAAAPEPWRTAVGAAMFTGVRLGELLAVGRDDIDLRRGVLTVNWNLTEVPGRTPWLQRETPRRRQASIPLIPFVADLLAAHLSGLGPTPQGVIFANGSGRLVDNAAFYRDCWNPTRAAAGYPKMEFHELRHTAASLLLAEAGVSLAELKVILGHSQIAHTVDIYGHLVPGRLDTIRDTFGAAVDAARSPAEAPETQHRRHLRIVR